MFLGWNQRLHVTNLWDVSAAAFPFSDMQMQKKICLHDTFAKHLYIHTSEKNHLMTALKPFSYI